MNLKRMIQMKKKKNNFFTFHKAILKNDAGVAIIMVLSSVVIMTAILAEFTYQTKLNKIRQYNITDRLQAKLNAESGIVLGMARLKIFQETQNFVAINENLQKTIKDAQLASLYTIANPLVLPIPSAIVQAEPTLGPAMEDFQKESLIQGEFSVAISPISSTININNLRIEKKSDDIEEEKPEDKEGKEKKLGPREFTRKKLIQILEDKIKKKAEEDDEFDAMYPNIDASALVDEIEYYISRADSGIHSDIAGRYSAKGIAPKHAPLTSIDELYLLLGWDDVIINLIKDQLTVNHPHVIPINEMTEDILKFLFPDISSHQIEEFFKRKNGDETNGIEPTVFLEEEDFKRVVVDIGIVTSNQYETRIEELEAAGMKIGISGKLFLVTSQGRYGRSTYTLKAVVDLPVRKYQKKPPKKKEADIENEEVNNEVETEKSEKKETFKIHQLLEPRIVDLTVS